MLFINEWLPNPTGNDAKGEFIELFNNGNAPVNLGGWVLKTESGKKFGLSGIISLQGYLVLPRSKTKLALKNDGGALFLYDPSGMLKDQSAFLGTAQEGQTFSRINYGTDPSQHFVFSDPTPGVANDMVMHNQIATNDYPLGISLGHASLSIVMVIVMACAIGVALTGIMIYALRQDENLSQLFFGRDEDAW